VSGRLIPFIIYGHQLRPWDIEEAARTVVSTITTSNHFATRPRRDVIEIAFPRHLSSQATNALLSRV